MFRTAKKTKGPVSPSSNPLSDTTAADLLIFAVSVGLGAGLAEVVFKTVRHGFAPPMFSSRDYVWMIPVAVMLSTVLGSTPFLIMRRLVNRPALVRMALISSCTVAIFDLLLFIPQVHDAVLLAFGLTLSIVISVPLADRLETAITYARKSAGWLILTVIALGVIVRGGGWLEENRAISNLPPPRKNSPNVILVTLDTVRPDHLSVYGYSRATTPHLEALAADGVVFEHAQASSSWTLPSHSTMFTGRWAHELSADWEAPLDGTYPTLAEFLAAHGYLTAGFAANTNYCSRHTGLNRGFVQYEDYTVSLGEIFRNSNLSVVPKNWRLRKLLKNDELLGRKSATAMNASIFEWLEQQVDRPYFLFVNYFDAHSPYLPPAPYNQAFGPPRPMGKVSPLLRWNFDPADKNRHLESAEVQLELDAYDGSLRYLDDQLGSLLGQMAKLGRLDNTLIIVTADHGEEFGEHGLYTHGNSLYRAVVDVPLILKFTGKLPRGARLNTPVSLRDLAATVVDVLGLSAESPFPGHSLARFWQDSHSAKADNFILQTVLYAKGNRKWFPVSKGDMHAMLSAGLRYILNGDGVEELYDFNNDPQEMNDLAKKPAYQATLGEFHRRLEDFLAGKSTDGWSTY